MSQVIQTPAVSSVSEVREVARALDEASEVTIEVDGTRRRLPHEVMTTLRAVVDAMARGEAITVVSQEQLLTTQEAADFLGVSRPTVVRLLTEGKIPFTQPNKHRRLRVSDLVAYRESELHRRRPILDNLTKEASADSPAGDSFVTTR